MQTNAGSKQNTIISFWNRKVFGYYFSIGVLILKWNKAEYSKEWGFCGNNLNASFKPGIRYDKAFFYLTKQEACIF